MTISNWELRACANRMTETHGEDAALRAAMNADLMLKKGDLDGQQAWLGIMRRINELASPAVSGTIN